MSTTFEDNPLLKDFDFPPFDSIDANHVRPGIHALLKKLPEKVEFEFKLGRSKPLYNAFKHITDSSDWEALSNARKRIVESQIKEAILNGVSLEDDKKDQFNKIQQAVKETGHRFRETILALGGGKAPLEVFVEFRGHEPSPEALLRHNEILPVSASA